MPCVIAATPFSVARYKAKTNKAAKAIARDLRSRLHRGNTEAERRRNRREVSITISPKPCPRKK